MTDHLLPEAIYRQHEGILSRVEAYLGHLISSAGNHDQSLALGIVSYAKQLAVITPEESKPTWLFDLLKFFDGATLGANRTGNKADEFAKFILTNFARMRDPILLGNARLYDFDAAYEDIRDAENIPETFDKLVGILEEIIALDLVEGRTVQDAIDRMKSLLQRNRRGSLASILVTMHYGRFFIEGFAGSLSTVKQLKPFVDSFRKEFEVAEEKSLLSQQILTRRAASQLTNTARLEGYLAQQKIEQSVVAGYLADASGDTQTA